MTCLAYFLTWTTYGTWLHGDERGSVDAFHNRVGTPVLAPDAARKSDAMSRLIDGAYTLDSITRPIVTKAMEDHACIRRWFIHALNVRTNHVHVVLGSFGAHSPELVMEQFKSWGTRRLIKAGFATSQTNVWTFHGSTRYLNTPESLAAAIHYVLHEQ